MNSIRKILIIFIIFLFIVASIAFGVRETTATTTVIRPTPNPTNIQTTPEPTLDIDDFSIPEFDSINLYDVNIAPSLVEPLPLEVFDWRTLYQELFTEVVIGDLVFNNGNGNYVEGECLIPSEGGYNVVVLIYDEIQPEDEKQEYANVYIDRRLHGRTNQGFRSSNKYITMYLEPDRYILDIEKWEYNSSANRWARAPNVRQPTSSYFDTSNEYILLIEVIFEGETQTYKYDIDCLRDSDLEIFE